MITIRFPLPTKPWSTNDAYNLNRYQRAAKVSVWRETARYAAMATAVAPFTSKVQVHISIPFTTNRRRDPMNYCGTVLKSVVDGFTDAGLWPDDNEKYVTHVEPELRKDPGGDIVVTLTEIVGDTDGR